MRQFQNECGEAKAPPKAGLSCVTDSLVSGTLIARKIVWRKAFSGATRYQFCPFCIRREGVRKKDIDRFLKLKFSRKKPGGEDTAFMESVYRRLSAMEAVRYKLLIKVSDDFGAVAYETGLRCPHCGSDVGIGDLEGFWCRQADARQGEKKYIRISGADWQRDFYGGRTDADNTDAGS